MDRCEKKNEKIFSLNNFGFKERNKIALLY